MYFLKKGATITVSYDYEGLWMKSVCLGPAGSYSDKAAKKYAVGEREYASAIKEVIRRVNDNETIGFVPIYNTLGGNEGYMEDHIRMFLDNRNEGVFIGNIVPLSIEHWICGKGNINDISIIKSHGKAIEQTKSGRDKSGINVVPEETLSTSYAAQEAADSDGSIGAICDLETALSYGLVPIRKLTDGKDNITTFGIIGTENYWYENRGAKKAPGEWVTSVIIRPLKAYATDRAGLLNDILKGLDGYNMKRLKSQDTGELMFLIELSGKHSEHMYDILDDIGNEVGANVDVLGSMPSIQNRKVMLYEAPKTPIRRPKKLW